jgi:hypothetical protein
MTARRKRNDKTKNKRQTKTNNNGLFVSPLKVVVVIADELVEFGAFVEFVFNELQRRTPSNSDPQSRCKCQILEFFKLPFFKLPFFKRQQRPQLRQVRMTA